MLKRILEKFKELRFILSSVCAFLIDNSLYYVFVHFVFGRLFSVGEVLASTLAFFAARIISSFSNFNVNFFFVFKGNDTYKRALIKYYLLAVPQGAVSLVLLDVLIANAQFVSDLVKVIVKILIETVLFVISYLIQNKWVFSKKTSKSRTSEQ